MPKYAWVDDKFDEWLKSQTKLSRSKLGMGEIGTRGITKILHEKIIIPNNINIPDMISIKKKKITKRGFR